MMIVLASGMSRPFSTIVVETSTSLELARQEGETLAAVLECTVKDYDEIYELTELSIGSHSLFVAAARRPAGTRCRVRIPARDVSIALDAPRETSILNIIPAVIDDIDACAGPGVLVKLAIDNQFILARITKKSLAALSLAKSQRVFVQIKGVALLRNND